MLSVPPPIIATAKLIKYADASAPVTFTGVQKIFVDGELIGAAPGIAVGQQLSDSSFHLYLCNEDWSVIAVVEGRSVSDLTSRAERWYHGLGERWLDTPYTAEDCDKFLNSDRGEARCSFCRRWDWEYSALFSDNGCNICDVCVTDFFSHLPSDQA